MQKAESAPVKIVRPDYNRRANWLIYAVSDDGPQKGSDLAVFQALAYYINSSDDEVWPHIDTIVRRSRMSRRTVFYSLANLKAQGYVTVVRRSISLGSHASNVYRLHRRAVLGAVKTPISIDRIDKKKGSQGANFAPCNVPVLHLTGAEFAPCKPSNRLRRELVSEERQRQGERRARGAAPPSPVTSLTVPKSPEDEAVAAWAARLLPELAIPADPKNLALAELAIRRLMKAEGLTVAEATRTIYDRRIKYMATPIGSKLKAAFFWLTDEDYRKKAPWENCGL